MPTLVPQNIHVHNTAGGWEGDEGQQAELGVLTAFRDPATLQAANGKQQCPPEWGKVPLFPKQRRGEQ